MKKIIGFASYFYTLWNYDREIRYTVDAYGDSHKSGIIHKYFYQKNISKDLGKVESLYPGVEIDQTLRGKVKDFQINEKIELPNNFFWFGKYNGRSIDDVIEVDLNYCIWVSENSHSYKLCENIKNHPKYIAHFAKIEADKIAKIKSLAKLSVGDDIDLSFVTNGTDDYFSNNGQYDYMEIGAANFRHKTKDSDGFEWSYSAYDLPSDRCRVYARHGDLNVIIENIEFKKMGGMYPYLIPMINGKYMRTKNKTIKVKVSKALGSYIDMNGNVTQRIEITISK